MERERRKEEKKKERRRKSAGFKSESEMRREEEKKKKRRSRVEGKRGEGQAVRNHGSSITCTALHHCRHPRHGCTGDPASIWRPLMLYSAA